MMYQQLWGYKVEEKLCLRVREQKSFNTTDLEHVMKIFITTESFMLDGRLVCLWRGMLMLIGMPC
jgi:hypothetical protein